MRKACLNTVYELAKDNDKVVFIGSDLGAGTLNEFKQEMPERFFMEGISEQHVIGMSAGIAMEGFIPYVNTIATFLTRRCLEQVIVDLCLHNLSVRLIGNGGGLVYAPLGPTHVAIEDIALMRAIPNMTILVPTDADEMQRLVKQTIDWQGPVYIRVAKGYDPIISNDGVECKIGKAIMMKPLGNVLIIATGVMVHRSLSAAKILESNGLSCGVMNIHTIKPLDEKAILQAASQVDAIVTVEEHTKMGGLGSAVIECLMDNMDNPPKVKRLSLPDQFTDDYGSQDSLLDSFALQPDTIASTIQEWWS
ncbi:MAG: transketolase [Methylococcales bacterium]|jgi:transketolase|nr:transketolase [Methylococcales bacterium]MBT7408724.1 transketolase [Methylococcales bacterium]